MGKMSQVTVAMDEMQAQIKTLPSITTKKRVDIISGAAAAILNMVVNIAQPRR